MKILIIITSHAELGNTGLKTGFWIEELAAPYYIFKDAGVQITLASPKGGQPPIDPKSNEPQNKTDATIRFEQDEDFQKILSQTKVLANMNEEDFDAVFYPGGHGPLWDLTNDQHSIKLIHDFCKADKPIAAVCHAPAVLLHAQNEQGNPFVQGKNVTGFSNTEEEAVELTEIVPFLLENELIAKGGIYSKKDDWQSHTVVDGRLITGQNPGSSEETALKLLEMIS